MDTTSINFMGPCIGCFGNENVTEIKIKNELLKTLFQANSLKLCYICKKLAHNTELFVQSVQSNQILLQSIRSIAGNKITIKPQPILKLQVVNFYCYEWGELFTGHDMSDTTETILGLENEDETQFDKELLTGYNIADTSETIVILENEDETQFDKELSTAHYVADTSETILGLDNEDETQVDKEILTGYNIADTNETMVKLENEDETQVDKEIFTGHDIVDTSETTVRLQNEVEIEFDKELFTGNDIADTLKLENEDEKEIQIDQDSTDVLELNDPLEITEDSMDYLTLESDDDINDVNLESPKVSKKVEKKKENNSLNKYSNALNDPLDITDDSLDDSKLEGRILRPKKRKIYYSKKKRRKKVLKKSKKVEEIKENHSSNNKSNDDSNDNSNENSEELSNIMTALYVTKDECIKEREIMAKRKIYLDAKFKCSHCLKGYTKINIYNNHMMLHQELAGNSDESKYECDICMQRLVSAEKLLRHQKDHQTRYKCVECGLKKACREDIQDHYTRLHTSNVYTCTLCPQKFKSRVTLREHMYSYHRRCNICYKTFSDMSIFRKHILLSHTGYKPGNEGLQARKSQIDHKTQPSKRFHCVRCNQLATLAICTSEPTPYKCAKCPASFTQSGILNTHVKLVHLKLTRDGLPKSSSNLDRSRYD